MSATTVKDCTEEQAAWVALAFDLVRFLDEHKEIIQDHRVGYGMTLEPKFNVSGRFVAALRELAAGDPGAVELKEERGNVYATRGFGPHSVTIYARASEAGGGVTTVEVHRYTIPSVAELLARAEGVTA